MSDEFFPADDVIRIASALAAESIDLLPDGMRAAASEAFRAVLMSHSGEHGEALRSLSALKKITGEEEPYALFLAAKECSAQLGKLTGDDPQSSVYRNRARRKLSKYLSADISSRPEEERAEAALLKARLDFAAGHRKGTFMGIIELPEGREVSSDDLSLPGCRIISSSASSVIFSIPDGILAEAEISEVPGSGSLLLLSVLAGGSDAVSAAMRFIELSVSYMERFSSSSLYVSGTLLTMEEAEEAMRDIEDDAFPIWFFARGVEMDDGKGGLAVSAHGAESFGVKEIRIEGLDERTKEKALNALSAILIFMVFSSSLRKSESFEIEGVRYILSSSTPSALSFRIG